MSEVTKTPVMSSCDHPFIQIMGKPLNPCVFCAIEKLENGNTQLRTERDTLRAIVGELVEALDDACSVYDPMCQMARITPLIARARAAIEGKP